MEQSDFLGEEPIFIIGYPKSGNTWLARLTADAFNSPMVGGDNPIDKADKQKNYTGKFVVLKAHYPEQNKPDYITGSSKVLYIVRDFRDVLISSYFFIHGGRGENRIALNNSHKFNINIICRFYFNHQIRRMIHRWTSHELTVFLNLINRRKITLCNWSEHVNYWIEFPNACVVKYEDLLADTFATLKSSFSKIGINCSERRLIEAIEHQSFKTRKKEFQKKGDQVNAKFMRKGVAGDWKRFLDKDMIERIKKEHGAMMNRLGYEI